MLEGFTELQLLISALPSDFARVEERFAEIRAEILAAFRAEDRPAGEVIDDYLARADALMTATPEGRAFEGAFALLRDDAMVAQLREDLTALLEHPLSDGLLADADRAELRGTVRLIREGLDRVLSQRSRVTSTLKDYIVSHDTARDRELEQTLRQVESELMTWMATSGPRATSRPAAAAGPGRRRPLPRAVPRPRRRRRAGPARRHHRAPRPPPVVRRAAGPGRPVHHRAARAARRGAALASTRPPRWARSSTRSSPSLRRPVEIFGPAAPGGRPRAARRAGPRATTGRCAPDGSERTFAVPRVPLPDPDLARAAPEDPR